LYPGPFQYWRFARNLPQRISRQLAYKYTVHIHAWKYAPHRDS
jgi:hypothetical protein